MQQVATDCDRKHLRHRGLKSPTADGNCADACPNGPVPRSGGETSSPQNIDHCHPREGTRGVKTIRDERWRLLALQGEELKIGRTLRPKTRQPCGVALKPEPVTRRDLTRHTQEPSMTAQRSGTGSVRGQGWTRRSSPQKLRRRPRENKQQSPVYSRSKETYNLIEPWHNVPSP